MGIDSSLRCRPTKVLARQIAGTDCKRDDLLIVCRFVIMVFVFVVPNLLLCQSSDARQSDFQLTPQEREWILGREIRYAPNPSWAPGDYIDREGIHRGIVADYISIFEEKLGTSFTKVYFNNWNDILEGLRFSEADFVGAIQRTEEREEYLQFTEPFITVPLVILTRQDRAVISPEDVSSMSLSIPAGYASVDYISETWPDADLQTFDSDLEAILQTSFGNADGVVTDMLAASHFIDVYGINNLHLAMTLDYSWELRLGSRSTLPQLNVILNKVLASISDSQRQEVYNRWVNLENIQAANILERNYRNLLYITILISCIICAVFYHNRSLKKEVKARTIELERELSEKALIEKNLTKTLNEREVLLAEIHHRVKNNMAVISGLLEFEILGRGDAYSPDVLSKSVMRIKTMAMIHERLYTSADFKSIPFHMYLDDLLVSVRSSYRNGKKIRFRTDADEVILNINVAIPAALLLNELVTNAFKHAFKGMTGGDILVKLFADGDQITLGVEDNGTGLPDSFDPKSRDTVGVMLVSVLSKQLKAERQIESDSSGARFTFKFENREKRGSSGNVYKSDN